MSVVRARFEDKMILDFSEGKVTRNRIRQSLRDVEVIEQLQVGSIIMLRDNFIKVGMYKINIFPNAVSTEPRAHLRDYGSLGISIYEHRTRAGQPYWQIIEPRKDARFKKQLWVKRTKGFRIRIKHLEEIIYYCHKLNRLRAFL